MYSEKCSQKNRRVHYWPIKKKSASGSRRLGIYNHMKKSRNKVFIFGIDGASPDLVFKKWKKDLPNMAKIINGGVYAETASSVPPISITAWSTMFSGRDPSEIGIFGYSYKNKRGKSEITTSRQVQDQRIWDIASAQSRRSVVLYVPLTYPVSKIKGVMVSDFLTPSIDGNCAHPASLKNDIKKMGNPSLFFDVAVGLAGHKGMNPDDLIKKTYYMTDMQLRLAKKLLSTEWDLFTMVMLGSDRIQHMFWNHFDPKHRRYVRNSKHKNVLRDYYLYLDKHLGEMMEQIPQDATIMLLSDHGMVRQNGKININNWLIENGYLKLKPEYQKDFANGKKVRFSTDMVDFEKSLCYGSGAYHARVCISKKLNATRYKALREELIRKIKAIKDDRGRKIGTKVFKKEEIYKNSRHPECPDLTIYFDNLAWASNPDFGQKGLYSFESAAGADAAGHSDTGMFAMKSPLLKKKGHLTKFDAKRIAPTILKALGAKIPKTIKVKPIM